MGFRGVQQRGDKMGQNATGVRVCKLKQSGWSLLSQKMDAFRAELKKVQNTASVPTLDVQIQQCESFIMMCERWLAEIDANELPSKSR